LLRTIRIIGAIAGALAAGGGAVGCGPAGGTSDRGERPRVVATTMPLQDFARQVGGDRVEVVGLLDADSEPHDYEPTPSDADAIAEARVVVANGAGLDAWLADLLAQARADAVRVEATRGMRLLPSGERGLPGDPHAWHDPKLAGRMVDHIAAGLARADPAGRAGYERRAAALRARIDHMAAEIRRSFARVPADRRVLVTSHDAFGYFARAYDVEVVGSVLPTVTAEVEPSAHEVRRPPGSPASTFIGAELANARAMLAAWRGP
jgi:zinc/manganese transport system substrate-binding protein/manganese/iron transport system substrate-binding protein